MSDLDHRAARTLRRLSTGVLALSALGCATGGSLGTRADGLQDRLEKIHVPAYNCAEVALATAESTLEFARIELSQGNSFRAQEHLNKAEHFTLEAEKVKPRMECYGDADGDGIPDPLDQCPNEPEDYNGFEDDDGCPDGHKDTDGDGIPDYRDKCPKEPGIPELEGCPPVDTDGDGIPDHLDKCPTVPGIPELEGCPAVDTDGDGIPDHIDKCPTEPGIPELEGCPPKLVKVTAEKIEISQKIFFATSKATIKPVSYGILDEIGEVLRGAPAMRVRIEGHTDSRGRKAFNQKLSQDRANSVKAYLVNQGIDESRLQAVGYGPDQPIEDNRTAAGREANRRVEFNIIK